MPSEVFCPFADDLEAVSNQVNEARHLKYHLHQSLIEFKKTTGIFSLFYNVWALTGIFT